MTTLFFLLALLTAAPVFAASSEESPEVRKPLYQLPADTKDMVVGTDDGLYRITENSTSLPLWTGGKVTQILHTSDMWYFLTSEGVLVSRDLVSFELKNKGLPALTIENYDGSQIVMSQQVQELKDICVNPSNAKELVTATKDEVFITYDGAENWRALGSMSQTTSGIKAVAVAEMPRYSSNGTLESGTDLVVFMSHSIFGFSYIMPERANPGWNDVSAGFKIMPSLTTPDEVADILPVLRTGADGSTYTELYISQTFLPCLYRFDWKNRRADCIYTGTEPSDTIDGLVRVENALLFTCPGAIGSFDFKDNISPGVPANLRMWEERFLNAGGGIINTAWIPKEMSGFGTGFALSELWMLSPGSVISKYGAKTLGRKSLYVPAYQVRAQTGTKGIEHYRKIIKDNNLNSLVIDMKDDYGLLRYDTRDPLVREKGTESQFAVNLDQFISEFKKDNVYLIARIVVFKDRNLTKYAGGKYAVWDNTKNAPWVGIKGYEDAPDGSKTTVFYDENWVDPYSPEVWEYDVAIAKELVTRGFDEIQFDYIRFPTDGYNLKNAVFRWCRKGMDKESALISFLSYARRNIDAPLGIDIYGANGWYRSGTRTGQDVEMLSKYVDVISPMFYPSHFEQTFMNYAPYPDRPYRIYFYGTYRNTVIGRNRIVVRPWVQAFNLGVSYDRLYYGSDYVQKEIFGVRDGINRGYMYWNNTGNYDTLLPDVGVKPYTGKAPEADPKFRKPAFGAGAEAVNALVLPIEGLFRFNPLQSMSRNISKR